MRRSFQEILELIAFGLIALVVGWLLIWGVGWVFTGVGLLFRIIAGFIWTILKYIIPVAIVALVVYLLVRMVMNQRDKPATASSDTAATPLATNQSSTNTQPAAPAPEATTPPVTQSSADDKRSVETRVDDAEPVDTDVDTSGFKKMDDLAEELEKDSSEDDKKDG